MEKPWWLQKIIDAFIDSIEWRDIKTPIQETFTYKCQKTYEAWEITFSPWIHEIYGGKNDGMIKTPKYEINLLNLSNQLEIVTYINFNTKKSSSRIEGIMGNDIVVIDICKNPPENSKTRKKINIFTGEITKVTIQ